MSRLDRTPLSSSLVASTPKAASAASSLGSSTPKGAAAAAAAAAAPHATMGSMLQPHTLAPVPLHCYVFYRDTTCSRGWSCGYVVQESVKQNQCVEVIPMKYVGSTESILEAFRSAPKRPFAHFHNSSHTYAVEGGKPPTRNLSISSQGGGSLLDRSGHRASEAGSILGADQSMRARNKSVVSSRRGKTKGFIPPADGAAEPQGGKGNFIDEVDPSLCASEVFRHVQILEAFRRFVDKERGVPSPTSISSPRVRPGAFPWGAKPVGGVASWYQVLPDVLFFENATRRVPPVLSQLERMFGYDQPPAAEGESSTAMNEWERSKRVRIDVYRSVLLVAVPGADLKVSLSYTSALSSASPAPPPPGAAASVAKVVSPRSAAPTPTTVTPPAVGTASGGAPRTANSAAMPRPPNERVLGSAGSNRKLRQGPVASDEPPRQAPRDNSPQPVVVDGGGGGGGGGGVLSNNTSSQATPTTTTLVVTTTITNNNNNNIATTSPSGTVIDGVLGITTEDVPTMLIRVESPHASGIARPPVKKTSSLAVSSRRSKRSAMVKMEGLGESCSASQSQMQQTLSSSIIGNQPVPTADYVVFDRSILEILPALLHTQHVAEEAPTVKAIDPEPKLTTGGMLTIPRLTDGWLYYCMKGSSREDARVSFDGFVGENIRNALRATVEVPPLAVLSALVSFFPTDVHDALLQSFATAIATIWLRMNSLSFSMVQHAFLSPTAMELSFEIKRQHRSDDVVELEKNDHIVAMDAIPSISKKGIAAVLSAIAFRWSRCPDKPAPAVDRTPASPLTSANNAKQQQMNGSIADRSLEFPAVFNPRCRGEGLTLSVCGSSSVTATPLAMPISAPASSTSLRVEVLQHVELSFLKLDDIDLTSSEVLFFESLDYALPWLKSLSLRGNFLSDATLIRIVNIFVKDVDERTRHERVLRAQRRRSKRASRRLSAATGSISSSMGGPTDLLGDDILGSGSSGCRDVAALKRLDVSLNRIGDEGVFALSDALGDGKVAPYLTMVNLEGNAVTKEIKDNVLEGMQCPAAAPAWTIPRHLKCEQRVRRRVMVLAFALLSSRDRQRIVGAARVAPQYNVNMFGDASPSFGASWESPTTSMALPTPRSNTGSPNRRTDSLFSGGLISPKDNNANFFFSGGGGGGGRSLSIPFVSYAPTIEAAGRRGSTSLSTGTTRANSATDTTIMESSSRSNMVSCESGHIGPSVTPSPTMNDRPRRRSTYRVSIVEVPVPLSKEEAMHLERYGSPRSNTPSEKTVATAHTDDDEDDDSGWSAAPSAAPSTTTNPLMAAVRRLSRRELSSVARIHRERMEAAEREQEHREMESLICSVAQYFTMFERRLPLSVLF